MAEDTALTDSARNLIVNADRFDWLHQSTWFGEPVLNLPTDMFAVQEIIFRTRPKYVIEVGVAWGGALLFYAALLELLGGERVIGIDKYIPPDLRLRLQQHGKVSSRLTLLEGSSTDPATFSEVEKILGGSRETLVILDSSHTQEHVLQELRLYSPLVGDGCYLICCDTIVEFIPKQTHRPRPWGPGNNPATALREFLKTDTGFVVDESISNRLLLTTQPGGYLQRCGSGNAAK